MHAHFAVHANMAAFTLTKYMTTCLLESWLPRCDMNEVMLQHMCILFSCNLGRAVQSGIPRCFGEPALATLLLTVACTAIRPNMCIGSTNACYSHSHSHSSRRGRHAEAKPPNMQCMDVESFLFWHSTASGYAIGKGNGGCSLHCRYGMPACAPPYLFMLVQRAVCCAVAIPSCRAAGCVQLTV